MNNNSIETKKCKDLTKISDLIHDVFDDIDNSINSSYNMSFVKTGFSNLDSIISGFKRGDLIVLASRPGMGKTSLALNFAYKISKNDYSVAYFSLESSGLQMTKRIFCIGSFVPMDSINSGKLTDENMNDIVNTAIELNNKKLFLCDDCHLTTDDIANKCKKLKEANGLDTVIIDYLQLLYCKDNLMNNNGQKRFLYKEDEMEIIVRDLKALAIELNVPIIILSQLSRMAETNDKPEISDSGVIGKYADVVLLITNKSNDNHDYNTTDIIIAKDRNGKTGTINLRFDKATGSFNEFDE